uniref:Uncharacterized protein n=1 Tax=Micrurus spixii TaxID=129469 RepID=A0A2D4LB34_9SAUR
MRSRRVLCLVWERVKLHNNFNDFKFYRKTAVGLTKPKHNAFPFVFLYIQKKKKFCSASNAKYNETKEMVGIVKHLCPLGHFVAWCINDLRVPLPLCFFP